MIEDFSSIKIIIPSIRKMTGSVSEKWLSIFKTNEKLPHLQILLEFLFSIPVSNAETERSFSLMNTAWRDESR